MWVAFSAVTLSKQSSVQGQSSPWSPPGASLGLSEADWLKLLRTVWFAGRNCIVPGTPKQFPVFSQVLVSSTYGYALKNKADFKSCGNQYLKKRSKSHPEAYAQRASSVKARCKWQSLSVPGRTGSREEWAGSFHHLPLICSRVLCLGAKSSLVQASKSDELWNSPHSPTLQLSPAPLHVPPECPCWLNNPVAGINSKCACRGTGALICAWKGISFENRSSLQY